MFYKVKLSNGSKGLLSLLKAAAEATDLEGGLLEFSSVLTEQTKSYSNKPTVSEVTDFKAETPPKAS